MTVSLSPVAGAGWQFFDNNGVPLTGGKLYTYASGTTTPQTTYTTIAGTPGTEHTNPIVLNSAGRVANSNEVWLTNGAAYKFVLKTSAEVLLWSADNVSGINDFSSLLPTIYNATGNGAAVAFTLAIAPTNENTTQVYINGVYQQKNTYAVVGTTLTFSQAPPVTSSIEVNYV